MSEAAARLAIQEVLAQIAEAHTAYPLVIELDNRTAVDQATQVHPYLQVDIDYLSGHQADLGDRPITTHYGQILIKVLVKCGAGAVEAANLRDFVIPYFNLKVLGPVHCRAAERHRQKEVKGWEAFPILVNFWQHEVSA